MSVSSHKLPFKAPLEGLKPLTAREQRLLHLLNQIITDVLEGNTVIDWQVDPVFIKFRGERTLHVIYEYPRSPEERGYS